MIFRPAQPTDQSGVILLIDTIFREYGDEVCLEGADRDLLDLVGSYEAIGGEFRVLHDGQTVRGTVALVPVVERPGVGMIRRLYLDSSLRGDGWGQRFIEWIFQTARERNYRRIELWCDLRFERAQAFYTRHGFTRGEIRHMSDGVMPYSEYFFHKEMEP